MKLKSILIPLMSAAAGFAAGWYAHQKKSANQTATALKQQADMYEKRLGDKNKQLKEADDLFQSATYQKALSRMDELQQRDWKMRTDAWYKNLEPGIYTMDEYDKMFKEICPEELDQLNRAEVKPPVLTDNEKPRKTTEKEGVVSVPLMDWHGDPVDDEDFDEDNYIPPEEDESPQANNLDYPILYISPDEVGQAPHYQVVYLNVFADGMVTDDALTVIPEEEVPDLIGEDYKSHFGEFEDEALWAMNGRNHTYYEVTLDSRTYREACRG